MLNFRIIINLRFSFTNFQFYLQNIILFFINYQTKLSDQRTLSRNLMEELDISKYLVVKKEGEDGPEVKGGNPDALIIHATVGTDNGMIILTSNMKFSLSLSRTPFKQLRHKHFI